MFVIDYIKQRAERRRRKSILKDIKKAKDFYLSYRSKYMCLCFMYVNDRKYGTSGKIHKRIPEFNREFTCTLHNCHVYKNYKVCSDYQAEEMFNHEEFDV